MLKRRSFQSECPKYILFIFFLGIGLHSFGQRWVVTPQGLRDANDTTKKYIIIRTGNLSAKNLYDRALKYIDLNNADSAKVIRNKWDSVDLIFDTYVPLLLIYDDLFGRFPIEAEYATELRFYQGMVRYEIISLNMKEADSDHQLLIRGKYLQAFIVYKSNGKLYKPQTKSEIENYFNLQAGMISVFLNQ